MLSDTIKSLRKKKGLSQAQIALKLGITQGAVSQWEIGKTEPSSDQLLALSKIFGVSVYELKGVEAPTPQKEPATSGGQSVEMYLQLTPENREKIDELIALYLAAQSNDPLHVAADQ